MKNWMLYIPLIIIFIIQYFDKAHKFFWIQILMLVVTIIIGIYIKFFKKTK